MRIEEIFKRIPTEPNNFPRFYAILGFTANQVKLKWEWQVDRRSAVSVKEGGLGWWGSQYRAHGKIQVERRGLGYRIYYDKGESTINFEDVVENGRSSYDIAKNLLANSKKVRISSKGKKYLIIPMGSDDKKADTALTIMATTKEPALTGGTVRRNQYATRKVTDKILGKSKSVAFGQKNEKGGSSTTVKNLVILTEDSNWKDYPAIKAHNFPKIIQREVDRLIGSQQFKKELMEALVYDIRAYVRDHPEERKNEL
ncbi:hypothetical protein [Leptospira sp. GIMC2001]|uniref:hypothetical protein n=1 Tax=Leptospira sp. GIMC2001 TaxID=1513297 RepID=UPI00234A1CEE|nr:hypothetical protein [Leptospira sp. GIMC2001]WCL51517.1 hypothetical protein O4O04_20080 [Leptospira sp. GIMC2001]